MLSDETAEEILRTGFSQQCTEREFWRALFPFLPSVLPTEEINQLLDQRVETSEPVIVDDLGDSK